MAGSRGFTLQCYFTMTSSRKDGGGGMAPDCERNPAGVAVRAAYQLCQRNFPRHTQGEYGGVGVPRTYSISCILRDGLAAVNSAFRARDELGAFGAAGQRHDLHVARGEQELHGIRHAVQLLHHLGFGVVQLDHVGAVDGCVDRFSRRVRQAHVEVTDAKQGRRCLVQRAGQAPEGERRTLRQGAKADHVRFGQQLRGRLVRCGPRRRPEPE